MLVAAAVLPHAPMLVPAIATGAAPELDGLRDECRAALAEVRARQPDVTYLVGLDSGPHAKSFAPWGVDERVDVPEPLPLSLLVGAWLTAGCSRSFVAVADDLDPQQCAELGAELAESAQRVAVVVTGDGSARHSEKGPGYLDDRAAGYDEVVAAALASADAGALLSLDPALSRELLVAGRAPWQVLAGAAGERRWNATATFSSPYGVGYHVAVWT